MKNVSEKTFRRLLYVTLATSLALNVYQHIGIRDIREAFSDRYEEMNNILERGQDGRLIDFLKQSKGHNI